MTENPQILFNKTIEQLRQLGARGGKAYGRNQRLRRLTMPAPPTAVPPQVNKQTTAEAIDILDASFPWLRPTGRRTGSELPRR